MPQLTDLEKAAPTVQDGSDGTDSDSDDSVPELEEAESTAAQSKVCETRYQIFAACPYVSIRYIQFGVGC